MVMGLIEFLPNYITYFLENKTGTKVASTYQNYKFITFEGCPIRNTKIVPKTKHQQKMSFLFYIKFIRI